MWVNLVRDQTGIMKESLWDETEGTESDGGALLNRCMAGKKDLRGFKRKADEKKRDERRAR